MGGAKEGLAYLYLSRSDDVTGRGDTPAQVTLTHREQHCKE